MFVNAVGMHPDRLTNMYFAYVFVLRAIGKARPFLMVRSRHALHVFCGFVWPRVKGGALFRVLLDYAYPPPSSISCRSPQTSFQMCLVFNEIFSAR